MNLVLQLLFAMKIIHGLIRLNLHPVSSPSPIFLLNHGGRGKQRGDGMRERGSFLLLHRRCNSSQSPAPAATAAADWTISNFYCCFHKQTVGADVKAKEIVLVQTAVCAFLRSHSKSHKEAKWGRIRRKESCSKKKKEYVRSSFNRLFIYLF